jgi:DNA-binding Lrp family transcriptional regulator
LDRIDIKVLGGLSRGTSSIGSQPVLQGVFGRIAKRLVLDEDTVRKRVDRLESAGIFRGWQLVVNPGVLGLKLYGAQVTVSPQLGIQDAVRKIMLVQGVTSIACEVVDTLGIGIICENELVFRNRIELISELAGTKELTTYAVNYPQPEVQLSRTDWQVINAFRPNPLIRYSEVADKLGISSRTVQRRLKKLAVSKAIFFRPIIDVSRFEGASSVSLFVSYASDEFKREVDRSIFGRFEDYILRAGWGSASHGYFEFIIPNIHVVKEIVDWTRSLRGVKELRLNLKYDSLSLYENALDEIIARQGQGPSPRRPN